MLNTTTNTNVSQMTPSKFRINTQYFSPHDLSLFVESMDTLTRLAREKRERKHRKKLFTADKVSNKLRTLPVINSLSHMDSFASSGDEADEELFIMESRKVPKRTNSEGSEYDETYFSAPSSSQSSPRHSALCQKELLKNSNSLRYSIATASDSEESGVFPIGTSKLDLDTVANKTSAEMITKSPTQYTKTGLLSLLRSRKTDKVPSVQLISCRPLDEYEILELYHQEQQQISPAALNQEKDRFARFSTFHLKKKAKVTFAKSDGSPKVHSLEKHLRYLTL